MHPQESEPQTTVLDIQKPSHPTAGDYLNFCSGSLCSPVPQLCQPSVQHLWMRICLMELTFSQEPSLSNIGEWKIQEMWSGVQIQRYFSHKNVKMTWFEVTKCSANKLAFFLLSLFISAQVHVGKPYYGFDRKEGCFGPLPQGWPCGNCVCGVHCPNLGGNIHFPLAAFSQRPAVWTSGLVQYHSRSSLLHRRLW